MGPGYVRAACCTILKLFSIDYCTLSLFYKDALYKDETFERTKIKDG